MLNTITPPSLRVLYWETNFAGKLGKPEFIHVAKAPVARITESAIESQQFEIRTSDGSHPPVRVKLDDICRLALHHLSDRLALASHGLTAFELQRKMLSKYRSLAPNSMVVIYFYKVVIT